MGTPLKQPHLERRIFQQRLWVAVMVVVVIFAALIGRYFYLQVIKHSYYAEQAEKNRIKTNRIKASRGLIYDRNGILLADNVTTYRLLLTPEKAGNIEQQLTELRKLIPLTADELSEINLQLQYNPIFKPLIIKDKLSDQQVAAFAVRQHQFPGFSTQPYLIRQYLYPVVMSHVIGYVGKITEQEYLLEDKVRYAADDYVGKTGIESYYEQQLHGHPGILSTVINAKGKILSEEINQPPKNGKPLTLTIDLALQQATYEAFDENTGSAIAVDPNTGEILAMVSKPGFNSNLFINGISHADYQQLTTSPEKPLFNRSIKGGYEPGSTIKPYMALAGLFYQLIDEDYTYFSRGFFQLPGQARKYHDWKRGGHGQVDIVNSLAESVNVFYYDLANRLGIDRIHDFLQPFGFGQLTGIDVSGEKQGILPSRGWKRAFRNMIWFPGETVIAGIGQGYFVITPIQMAQALAIFSAKGEINPLHLVQKPVKTEHLPMEISAKDWQIAHDGMIAVVNAANGTGRSIRSDDYLIAGKSGTSQVYGKSEEDIYKKSEDLPKELRNHALFIAFAPAEQPQIAVVVVAEHGSSGSKAAAPIARKIIDAHLKKPQENPSL
ncbi:penicillin-binding protein 2 [Marinicella gelatinilytica]|uniref:penicillin-binding protein 2 n=1 Tax=Marinicella gelatinilytica TaxID=2996017 RepID=UPI00226086AA|nr:penicillin-binding protein 2 [Marinicella gelatinilytica]MCX7545559.1 penicillin-binding protein 2 [Marinicella gelatinilytica]